MNCQEILPKFNRLTVLKKEFEESLEKTRENKRGQVPFLTKYNMILFQHGKNN